ncbi:hypothetical protein D3C74_429910 [compost metagenome]
MTILIILCTLLTVTYYVISSFDFFKFCFRISSLVYVRVILTGKLTVSLFNLIVVSRFTNAKHLIIITLFSHSSTPISFTISHIVTKGKPKRGSPGYDFPSNSNVTDV